MQMGAGIAPIGDYVPYVKWIGFKEKKDSESNLLNANRCGIWISFLWVPVHF